MSGNFIHRDTIKKAEEYYSAADIAWLKQTQYSGDIEDVHKHRGVETFLKGETGFNSPTFKQNCDVIHRYDDGRPLTKK